MAHRLRHWFCGVAILGVVGALGIPAASAAHGPPVTNDPMVAPTPPEVVTPEGATPTGSIVYIRANNVYLTNATGSQARRLTSNGTTTLPYRGPSQSTAGIIAVARGRTIVLLSRTGALLKAIVPSSAHVVGTGDGTCTNTTSGYICGHGITETALSPDGTKIAFTTDYYLYDRPDKFYFERTYVYSTSTGQALSVSPGAHYGNPAWSSNSTLVLEKLTEFGNAGRIFRWTTGGRPILWFGGAGATWDPDLATANNNVVYLSGGYQESTGLYYGHSSGFGQAPSIYCRIGEPYGHFDDPTWSPDGSWLAWEESSLDSATGSGQGVWVIRTGAPRSGSDCARFASTYRRMIGGATDPDWGPAAY